MRIIRLTRQRGAMVLNAILAVAALLALGAGGNYLYADYTAGQEAKKQATNIDGALSGGVAYTKKYMTQLLNNQAISGFTAPYAPTVGQLATAGMLPAGYTDAGQLGGPLKISITREPTGCTGAQCVLSVKVYTSAAVTLPNGQADDKKAARIVEAIPSGAGWKALPGNPALVVKNNGVTLPNPLGAVKGVVMAAAWIGTNKQSATVPPVYYEYKSGSCPAGQIGSRSYSRSVTTDKWGVETRSGWSLDSDDCADPPPPPTCSNGASDYPTCTPPSCANGASDYPTCTPPAPPTCSNGAKDYPTCTPPTCANGAKDYPTCTPTTGSGGDSGGGGTTTPPPTVTCTPATNTSTATCTAPMVGSVTTTTTTTCPAGSYGAPQTSTSTAGNCALPQLPPPTGSCAAVPAKGIPSSCSYGGAVSNSGGSQGAIPAGKNGDTVGFPVCAYSGGWGACFCGEGQATCVNGSWNGLVW